MIRLNTTDGDAITYTYVHTAFINNTAKVTVINSHRINLEAIDSVYIGSEEQHKFKNVFRHFNSENKLIVSPNNKNRIKWGVKV